MSDSTQTLLLRHSFPLNSYQECLDFLYRRTNYERTTPDLKKSHDFKLDRMRMILSALGDPQQTLRAWHVAGTKGKGSTCQFLASMLQASGRKVGLFTSPHISRFEERMMVNGQMMSESDFVTLLNSFLVRVGGLPDHLLEEMTFFELVTALAWMHFSNQNVGEVVLEVGLGGRLDCTNLCNPVATAITRIGRDHVKVLGEEIWQIASEKAGIIKPGVPVINAAIVPDAKRVVTMTAMEMSAPLSILNEQIQIDIEHAWEEDDPQSRFSVCVGTWCFEEMSISQCGTHQIDNAVTALGMIAAVMKQDPEFRPSIEHLRTGLAQSSLPLRIEKVSLEPLIIVVVAHNGPSAQALVNTLRSLRVNRKRLLLAASRDKEIDEIIEPLVDYFDEVIVTKYLNNPRAADPIELASIYRGMSKGCLIEVCENPAEGLDQLIWRSSKDDLVCVSGSFFLAAEMKEHLQRRNGTV